jgi:Protein of unknown function (DUF3365)
MLQWRRSTRAMAWLAAAGMSLATNVRSAEAETGWEARSQVLADRLVSELKAELTQAMQHGGPVAAIEVCRSRAPAIAANLSASSGAQVGRTALRVRNPANAPDAFERAVLDQFAGELARSKSPADAPPPTAKLELHSAAGVERRYLRAIVMQPLCATCHGTALAPEVEAAIRQQYPDDAATGFEPGQLRGAVTVRWESVR